VDAVPRRYAFLMRFGINLCRPFALRAPAGFPAALPIAAPKEVHSSWTGRHRFSYPSGFLTLRRREDKRVVGVLAVCFDKAGAKISVQSAGSGFQPLHGLAIARFGGIPSVERQTGRNL